MTGGKPTVKVHRKPCVWWSCVVDLMHHGTKCSYCSTSATTLNICCIENLQVPATFIGEVHPRQQCMENRAGVNSISFNSSSISFNSNFFQFKFLSIQISFNSNFFQFKLNI